MFARVKKSGQHTYLQIVQNRREGTQGALVGTSYRPKVSK
jgi:hypothetical protein